MGGAPPASTHEVSVVKELQLRLLEPTRMTPYRFLEEQSAVRPLKKTTLFGEPTVAEKLLAALTVTSKVLAMVMSPLKFLKKAC